MADGQKDKTAIWVALIAAFSSIAVVLINNAYHPVQPTIITTPPAPKPQPQPNVPPDTHSEPTPAVKTPDSHGEKSRGDTSPAQETGGSSDQSSSPKKQVELDNHLPKGPTRVSSGVMQSLKLSGSNPEYPPIARAAHVSGAVVLHAIISKNGTITDLTVISGPEMLRKAATEAAKDWRYKPYLLNGEPTEVDTEITINFNFGGG